MTERTRTARVALLGALAGLAACVHAPGGHADFSVVSRKVYRAGEVEVVGHIDERRCLHSVLLFAWGDSFDHEYLIAKALREHGADAITNAQVKYTLLPLILYGRDCAHVTGDLIRFKLRQPMAANGEAP